MAERRVVQPAGLQLSNIAQQHIIEISNPQRGHSVAVEPAEHESAKPAILFDDQSPISHLSVAFGGGRGIEGEQFDLLVPNTVGQSAQPDDDKIFPSGADFHAASVDALPGSAHPLGLLGAEGHTGAGNSLADAGSGGHRNLAAAVVAPGFPKNHPMAKRKQISLATLAHEAFIAGSLEMDVGFWGNLGAVSKPGRARSSGTQI
jgi:hypothetical protein